MTQVVDEELRQVYLREMGIRTYFPRSALPGAGASHEYACSTQGPGMQEQGVGAEERRTPAAESSSRSLDVPVSSPEPSPSPSAREPAGETRSGPDAGMSPSVPSAGAENALSRFAFAWFTVDERLAVVAELPPGDGDLPASCRDMLARMLAALQPRYRGIPLRETVFRWPLAEDHMLTGDAPADEDAARQAVNGFIARRLRESPAGCLLVLAEQPLAWLYPVGTDLSAMKGQLARHEQLGLDVLQTHSLQAMLADASLKKPAWKALQSLVPRLETGGEGGA